MMPLGRRPPSAPPRDQVIQLPSVIGPPPQHLRLPSLTLPPLSLVAAEGARGNPRRIGFPRRNSSTRTPGLGSFTARFERHCVRCLPIASTASSHRHPIGAFATTVCQRSYGKETPSARTGGM